MLQPLQPKKNHGTLLGENEMYVSHSRVDIQNADFRERFLVQSGEKLIPVATSDVAYFYAEDRWTYLITHENNRYLVDHTLKELEEMMDPDEFFRVNRSYLVCHRSICSLSPYLKGQLQVKIKPSVSQPVVVSRAKTPVLKHWLNQ